MFLWRKCAYAVFPPNNPDETLALMSLPVFSKHALRLNQWFDKVKGNLTQTLMPCIACSKPVLVTQEHPLTLCEPCQHGIIFRDPLPLNLDGATPLIDSSKPSLYAACMFTQQMKTWLFQHKFYHRHDNTVLMAEVLAAYWHHIMAEQGGPSRWLVVPIPPHAKHSPNSHQGSHLADIMRPMASSLGFDFVEHGLCWRRTVAPQHTLVNRHQRRQNMLKALAVSPKLHYHLADDTGILVVDDMVTTGSTMDAALEALASNAPGYPMAGLAMSQVPLSLKRIRHRSVEIPVLMPVGEQLN